MSSSTQAALAGQHQAAVEGAALDHEDVAHRAPVDLAPVVAQPALPERGERQVIERRLAGAPGQQPRGDDQGAGEAGGVEIGHRRALVDGPPRAGLVGRAAQEHVLGRQPLEPGRHRAGHLGSAAGVAQSPVAVPQHGVARQPVDGVEVEVAALPGRLEGQLVAHPNPGHHVEVVRHRDVGLAPRIAGDEQEPARGQPALAQLSQSQDHGGRVAVVIHAGRDHRRDL